MKIVYTLFIKGELVLLNVKRFNSILSFLTSTFTEINLQTCAVLPSRTGTNLH